MRVATLFERVLGFDAVSVASVEVVERGGAEVVEVGLVRRRSCFAMSPDSRCCTVQATV